MEAFGGDAHWRVIPGMRACGLSLLAFESLQDFRSGVPSLLWHPQHIRSKALALLEVYIAFQTQPDRRLYHSDFVPPSLSIDQHLERAPEPNSRHLDTLAVANLHHGLHNLLEEAFSFTAQYRYSDFLPDLHFFRRL